MGNDTLTVTDNRTGLRYQLPITDGSVLAKDFRQIRASEGDFGLMVYDPGFTNTASCRSAITHVDGESGILSTADTLSKNWRAQHLPGDGLPLIHGDLPSKTQLDQWVHEITFHTYVHENVKKFVEGFQYDAPPYGHARGNRRRAVDHFIPMRNTSTTRKPGTSRLSD